MAIVCIPQGIPVNAILNKRKSKTTTFTVYKGQINAAQKPIVL